MSKLTLDEIAALAGVSRATVSRVVNERTNVSPEARDRVQQVIARTGYRPNLAARSLAGSRSGIFGLIVPETTEVLFTDPYFAYLIQGVAEACNQYDYILSLILLPLGEAHARLPALLLQGRSFDGLIVTTSYIDDLLIPYLLHNRIPFVAIGPQPDPRVSFVDSDNHGGAYAGVQHLIQLGYKRIATITGPMNNLAAVHRRQGYLNALWDHHLAVNESLISAGNFSEDSGRRAMEQLLPFDPEAVFVASDTMALGALRALRAAGRAVPRDLALVSYDDLPPATLADPPLTTVRQPIKQNGRQAVETLLDILKNGPEPARHIIAPTQLIVRASCGAAP
jgi:LacI family transcriptional regulator